MRDVFDGTGHLLSVRHLIIRCLCPIGSCYGGPEDFFLEEPRGFDQTVTQTQLYFYWYRCECGHKESGPVEFSEHDQNPQVARSIHVFIPSRLPIRSHLAAGASFLLHRLYMCFEWCLCQTFKEYWSFAVYSVSFDCRSYSSWYFYYFTSLRDKVQEIKAWRYPIYESPKGSPSRSVAFVCGSYQNAAYRKWLTYLPTSRYIQHPSAGRFIAVRSGFFDRFGGHFNGCCELCSYSGPSNYADYTQETLDEPRYHERHRGLYQHIMSDGSSFRNL